MTNQPHLTNKQQDILRLIYRYRFIDRIQLQTLMHHKDKRRIAAWLQDLRQNNFIDWIYDAKDFAQKTKPAIYYLSLEGIRWLSQYEDYPPEELRKRYREASRQPDFINRCQLIADCGINLEAKTTAKTRYVYETESDYTHPDSEYHFLSELRPQLCYEKQTPRAKTVYLVEAFDSTTPRYMVRKRLKEYIAYITGEEWENETEDDEPPIVLIVCPMVPTLASAKRLTRTLLEDDIDYDEITDDEDKPYHIRFSLAEKVRKQGVTGPIWEEP